MVESGAGKENKPEVLQNTEGGLERPHGVFFISFKESPSLSKRSEERNMIYHISFKESPFLSKRSEERNMIYHISFEVELILE